MPNAATVFTRVLADLFPGKPAAQADAHASSPEPDTAPPAPSGPVPADQGTAAYVVGQGAPNETLVTIGDTPHLFVDEGDHIVQFEPAFDDHTEETEFGVKIMPDLTPHWSKVVVHRCALKAAIAAAIRRGGTAAPTTSASVQEPAGKVMPSSVDSDEPVDARDVTHVRKRRPDTVDASSVTGRIVSWGEEKFPDRKRPGRFYKSFAMHIDTASGERTLQGEGLKEAIAECHCSVGDTVSVRRLRKIKVPAIRGDGSPIMADGNQVMWDKWLWSITK